MTWMPEENSGSRLRDIIGSDVGSYALPLLAGLGAVYSPRATHGVLTGLNTWNAIDEQRRQKQKEQRFRDVMTGAGGPLEPQRSVENTEEEILSNSMDPAEMAKLNTRGGMFPEPQRQLIMAGSELEPSSTLHALLGATLPKTRPDLAPEQADYYRARADAARNPQARPMNPAQENYYNTRSDVLRNPPARPATPLDPARKANLEADTDYKKALTKRQGTLTEQLGTMTGANLVALRNSKVRELQTYPDPEREKQLRAEIQQVDVEINRRGGASPRQNRLKFDAQGNPVK